MDFCDVIVIFQTPKRNVSFIISQLIPLVWLVKILLILGLTEPYFVRQSCHQSLMGDLSK